MDAITVSAVLSARIDSGALRHDPAQVEAAKAMDALLARLSERPRRSWLGWSNAEAVTGLYLWGGVGRGKSMLMDIFFELAPVEDKSRIHFHAFMIDVHERIARWRNMSKSERKDDPSFARRDGDDPITPVARQIAAKANLLCFDEFHVTDITDAMILSRLFESLFEQGITVLATSNRHPDQLYKNGLNRQLFLPFIELLKSKMDVMEFPGETDHRLKQITAAPTYYTPLGPDTDKKIEQVWQRLIGGAEPKPTSLTVKGRKLELRRTAAGVARASFARLCDRALGAEDYLRLSQSFQTVIIENIPQMGPEERNQAKRFVTLIDALYETRTKLIASAEVEPSQLYIDGDGSFEFERTVSRLIEMQSKAYLGERRIFTAL